MGFCFIFEIKAERLEGPPSSRTRSHYARPRNTLPVYEPTLPDIRVIPGTKNTPSSLRSNDLDNTKETIQIL